MLLLWAWGGGGLEKGRAPDSAPPEQAHAWLACHGKWAAVGWVQVSLRMQTHHGTSVVGCCDGAESLLACRVPEKQDTSSNRGWGWGGETMLHPLPKHP